MKAQAKAAVLTVIALIFFGASAAESEAAFSIQDFSAASLDADGIEDNRAGAHPFSSVNEISFGLKSWGGVDGYVRDVEAALPAGYSGNPTAVPYCDKEVFARFVYGEGGRCPLASQVGLVGLSTQTVLGEAIGSPVVVFEIPYLEPIYNLPPPLGTAAEFGFVIAQAAVRFKAGVGYVDGEYRVVANFDKTSQGLGVAGSTITLWGEPMSPSHDDQRGFVSAGDITSCAIVNVREPGACPGNPVVGQSREAFVTNPTSCRPQSAVVRANSWQDPGAFSTFRFTSAEPITGCEVLEFKPELRAEVDTSAAGQPSGLAVDLHFPQNEDPDGLATAHLKDAKVTLPEGMAISPSSASGLASCSDEQLGMAEAQRTQPNSCPNASKLGTVEATTPLLEETLSGGVFLRSQASNDPESGEMFRIALALENAERGVVIKLPGKVRVNPNTGRVVTEFNDNPQFPVEDVRLNLKTGARAALTLPESCGMHVIKAELNSWGGQVSTLKSSFAVSSGCTPGAFDPKLQAGTANPLAGAHSPFTMRLTRADGQPNISSLEATLPEGLVATLKGVALCPEAAAPTGNCPSGSQVGTTTVGAGAGPSPVFVPEPGKEPTALYLAGPYKGAPLSLVAKVPAQAGPFDLGTVTVRNALFVDPTTTQVTAKSDPLPQMIAGVPVSYRDIRVEVNRPGFTLNPTSCDPMAIDSKVAATNGASASPSARFQVGSCAELPFKPRLAIRLSGKTHRSGHPKLKATLRMPSGSANIARAQVTLPKTALLAQEHIRTICTRVQYAAKSCPKGSVYGYARAWSPLLDQPLQGPVYLRSSSNPLPDLVASLDGQIHADLVGRIDSVNARIRTTFESVPDAPVSKFEITMQGGKKSLLVNNTNLCKAKPRASVSYDAHSGKSYEAGPLVKADCGKKSRKGTKRGKK